MSLRFLVLLSLTSTTACIASPHLDPVEEAASADPTPATPVSGEGDDRMVLVPATTFASAGALAPAAPGGKGGDGDPEKKKGKPDGGGAGAGGGGGDGGASATTSSITVPAFWLDVNEVSAGAYAACVSAGVCTPAGKGDGCTMALSVASHPVNCVSLEQARTFCTSRGKRLVTNDEWTAAAAGSTLRPYPWGSDAPTAAHLNACGTECAPSAMYPESDGWAKTAPRASFLAGRTPEGVFDLAGNVAEWVDLPGTTAVRGGSWQDTDRTQVGALALRIVSAGDATVGFRCARDDD